MKPSDEIELEFTKSNFIFLLEHGLIPESSPYSHKQIARWCERFWNKYMDIDTSTDIESIMPLLADVETQWDLYLVDTSELKSQNLESVCMLTVWFQNWLGEVDA
jgi:hypothetical protein